MKTIFALSVLMLALPMMAMHENDAQRAPEPLMMTETVRNAVTAVRHGKCGAACCFMCCVGPCCACPCDTGIALYETSKPLIKNVAYIADQLGMVTKKKQ
ncbi:MAG: hypothetical protein WD055_00250 [Candidatus Dependentiae bacterium]